MKATTKFLLSGIIIIVIALISQFDSRTLLSSTISSFTSGAQSGDYDTGGSGGEAAAGQNTGSNLLKLGYFPNLNHAQAIIGLANGHFQEALSNNSINGSQEKKIDIKEYVFSAGPSAIEALFAGQIDVAYVGPNPAINGYLASNGYLDTIVVLMNYRRSEKRH